MCYKYSRLYNKYQKKCSFFLIRSIVHAHKETQAAPPPCPSPKGRGVICVMPLVVHKCLRPPLLDYLSKLYYSSELFPALPLSAGEGAGGEAFFYIMQKGRRKIIFYIFPFYLYSFLSPPSSSSPLRAYPQGYCCICSPPCMGRGVRKSQLGDLLYYCPT